MTLQEPEPASAPPRGPRLFGPELWVRLASALVMAAVALFLTWWGRLPFALLILAVSLAMSWEWARVVRGEAAGPAFLTHMLAVSVAIVLAGFDLAVLGLLVAVVGAILVALQSLGLGSPAAAGGVLYVAAPGISMIWLRSDPEFGFLAIVFLFLVVWTTDTGAYAAGRLIGGPRLWPRVSPNKTWSGLGGGILAALVVSVLFARFVMGSGAVRLALVGIALAAISQAGDLAESALKRGFGVKDSSALIPGHGGFMDRLDGLVFAAAAAALVAVLTNVLAPGRSLLLGW
ncbi:MAG: phosphatidate cytidylyltransferase [Hyphomicrobiaceae bacterium]